ncbi:MAG TPA: tetratricopeptide repeat protein [Candidatus Kapabacteria bacterium]|nr:tetratricopeptide repeat protein [Candidatus Kapabacteria bacterium]
MSKKAILFYGCFMFILLARVFPQGDVNVLESRLARAAGEERLKILVELTKRYQTDDLDKAYAYGKNALELMRRVPNASDEAMLLNLLGRIAYKLGNFQASIVYSGRGLEIAQKTGNKYECAAALYNLGMGNKYLADYNPALESLSRARAIYEELGDMDNIAACLNQIGLVYRRVNDYSRALEFIMKAGNIYDKLEEKHRLSSTYNNIGIIYFNMGQPDIAVAYYKKALKIDEEQNDLEGIAIAQMNIAEIYDSQKKYDEALALYKKSLSVFEKVGSKKNIANVLMSIGSNYEKRNDFQRALRYYTRAKKIKEEIHEYYGIVEALLGLGGIYRRLGQFGPALDHLSEALPLSSKIHYTQGAGEIYLELSTLFQDMKDFPKALAYYKKFKETNDLVFNEKNSRGIAELQTRFDLERKEKEISLLKKDQQIQKLDLERQQNFTTYLIIISILILILAFVIYTRYRLKARVNLELIRYRERLSEQVEERTRELKDAQVELVRKERLAVLGQLTATVAHEIRNPLGTVRASIFSLEKALENNNLDRVGQAVKLAERNIVRCDDIINDLLDFTRRREPRPEPTVIDSWLENVLNERPLPEKIICIKELTSGLEIPIDRERLLRALLNILDNAVDALQEKDAPGNRLTLSTNANAGAGRLEIRVTDTGPGIPAANLDKIFEPLFTTKRFGFGLGLAVVKNIMAEHGGGVDIGSTMGRGTTVTLWLPIIM